jgi:hypothetical protein
MHLASRTIVGTIQVQPALRPSRRRPRLADDSSLADLLASLAHCPSLAGASTRLVASGRIGRFLPPDEPAYDAIEADVAQLADELDREYELVSSR